MRNFWLCAGTAALAVHAFPAAAAVDAASDPGAALVQTADAARTVNFQGVLLYRGDRAMEVLKVTHRFKNGHEAEHIVTLNGDPREMIRKDNQLICILPRDRRFNLDRPAVKGFLNQLSPERLQALSKWYEFRYLGTSRIAGRDCEGVAVVPKDQYRFGYQVWADIETHVPLRVNLLGGNGHRLEEVMFTEIQFPKSIPDSAFKAKVDGSKYQVVTSKLPSASAAQQQPVTNSSQVGWEFDKLPPGYQVMLRDKRELPDGLGRVQHILLSDGLSAVSVFAAPQPAGRQNAGFNGLSRMGAVEAYGRVVDGFHVTVVGEAPEATVRMIGDSIQRVPGSSSGGTQPSADTAGKQP